MMVVVVKIECPICKQKMDRDVKNEIAIWMCKTCCYRLIHHINVNPYLYFLQQHQYQRRGYYYEKGGKGKGYYTVSSK